MIREHEKEAWRRRRRRKGGGHLKGVFCSPDTRRVTGKWDVRFTTGTLTRDTKSLMLPGTGGNG